MKLVPWEGWIVDKTEEITYKVGDGKTQIAKAGNSTVDSLFWEDEDHKPTMKFSDYEKNINSIITSHSILPYIAVTLDASDQYAKYTYKLDGKIVTGTVNTKEGQKLELTYEITDSSYELSKAAGGIVLGIGSSKTKVTKTINIDSSMQGETINKEVFGIETVKKGG